METPLSEVRDQLPVRTIRSQPLQPPPAAPIGRPLDPLWRSPTGALLWRTAGGTAGGTAASSAVPVRITRLFPWSYPNQYLSIRNEQGDEFALIESLDELDARERALVDEALVETGFLFEVEKIYSVAEEFQLRVWRVLTPRGDRQFQTTLEEWPTPLPGGGLMIEDVAGDLFRIARPELLDEESRKILWPFLD